MASVKSRLTKKEQQEFVIELYVLLHKLTGNDWAEIAGLPQRTFYTHVDKFMKKKGLK